MSLREYLPQSKYLDLDVSLSTHVTSTHKETPLPVVLVMDGAPRFPAEAGMSFGMVKGEVMKLEVLELVDSESQDPRDVSGSDDGGVVMGWGERHVIMVK